MNRTEHYASYKWIKVKKHKDDPSKTWEERYRALEEHHIQETTFLIDEVRKLAAEMDEALRPKTIEEIIRQCKKWRLTDAEVEKLLE